MAVQESGLRVSLRRGQLSLFLPPSSLLSCTSSALARGEPSSTIPQHHGTNPHQQIKVETPPQNRTPPSSPSPPSLADPSLNAREQVELPASLRQELQDLGHIPKPGKGKLGRKEKRKAAREGVKGARAAHFSGGEGGKKRKSEEEEEEVPQQGGKRAKPNPTPAAADVAEPETAAPPPPAPKPHQTPLERLLAKQESRSSPAASKKKKKNPAESAEDLEIAWLEAKLGVRGGDPALKDKEGGMWKGEMRDDGLDGEFTLTSEEGGELTSLSLSLGVEFLQSFLAG